MTRLLDIIISVFTLLLFSPILILIAIIILLESPGGFIYKQERVGLNGKSFKVYKFRTMFKDSDVHSLLTVGSRDSRITKSGYYLRKFKFDEFPQFFNVLKGDMSLVGPRPEVKKFVKLYNNHQLKILSIRPGITDFASISYFDENELLAKAKNPEHYYINEIMPRKVELNLIYVNNYTLKNYFIVLKITIMRIFK